MPSVVTTLSIIVWPAGTRHTPLRHRADTQEAAEHLSDEPTRPRACLPAARISLVFFCSGSPDVSVNVGGESEGILAATGVAPAAAVDAPTGSVPGLTVSAPADEAVSSPPLDSSRLSAAFGAALGAVDAEEDAAGEAEIDVGDTSASVSVAPPAYAEGEAVAGIPGVNTGAPATSGGGGGGSDLSFEKQLAAALDAAGVPVDESAAPAGDAAAAAADAAADAAGADAAGSEPKKSGGVFGYLFGGGGARDEAEKDSADGESRVRVGGGRSATAAAVVWQAGVSCSLYGPRREPEGRGAPWTGRDPVFPVVDWFSDRVFFVPHVSIERSTG